MVDLDAVYPNYGLAQHKGYGTRFHLDCLSQYGPSSVHRFSFAPVKETTRLI
jgi:ribonuclease HII